MAHPRSRRRKKLSRFTIFGVTILCAVLCSILAYKNQSLEAKSAEYSQQIQELRAEQEDLRSETKELEEYKSYVKTDKFVEDVAREKLGLVYPDEVIFEPEEQ